MLPLLTLTRTASAEQGQERRLLLLNPGDQPADEAEARNAVMMDTLTRLKWFTAYRAKLEAWRRGEGPRPEYPNDLVQGAQDLVDLIMSLSPAQLRGALDVAELLANDKQS